MDKNRALFLDRDGTLIRDCHYLSDPDKVEVISGVGESLKKASHAGFLLFLHTNQSGIARDIMIGLRFMPVIKGCFEN